MPAVIDRMISYKNNKITAVKVKTLNAMRDFIYINDVCSALNVLLEKGVSGEIYNVCTGRGTYIEEAIKILKELLNILELPLEVERNDVI